MTAPSKKGVRFHSSASVADFAKVASDPSLHELLLRDKEPAVQLQEERKRDFCALYDPSEPIVVDRFKEDNRRQQRTVFDFARWATHRSTTRYLRHTLGRPLWRMIRQLALPLLYVLVVSLAVCSYQAAREAGLLPASFPSLQLDGREPFQLTSFALSLLLVFRTNSSYSRWLDARKTWGLVLNRSRDFVRQVLSWVPEEEGEVRAALCRWAAAFPRALKCHLRVGCQALVELQGTLEPQELEALARTNHYPLFILQVLSRLVSRARLPPAALLALDSNLTAFEDCLGQCERILKTPIPLAYTRHTSRFMMIWLTMLPFTLWDTCGWFTVALSTLIAFLLLGVEDIGVEIEEPFSILALEAICDTAELDIRQLQRSHALAGECWRPLGEQSSYSSCSSEGAGQGGSDSGGDGAAGVKPGARGGALLSRGGGWGAGSVGAGAGGVVQLEP